MADPGGLDITALSSLSMEDDGLVNHYSSRRTPDHHRQTSYGTYTNGTGPHDDEGAIHISHRVSGINFTPTLHDSLVNEIRKLRNKLDKKENEVKLLNEELGASCDHVSYFRCIARVS